MSKPTYRCSAKGHLMAPVKDRAGQEEVRDCWEHGCPPVEVSQKLGYALDYCSRGAKPSNFSNGHWTGVELIDLEEAYLWIRKWGPLEVVPREDTGKNSLFE